MYRRPILTLTIMLCAAVTPLAGQQAADSTRAERTSSVSDTLSRSTPVGPRLSPQFQHFQPSLKLGSVSEASSAAAAGGGQHTIVISTLVLVLAVVIIVLLVVR